MTEQPVSSTSLSVDQMAQAHSRFLVIRPALEDGVSQAQVARTHNIPPSTVQRWVKRYREKGLYGLADAEERSDKGKPRRLFPDVISQVEKLASQTPTRSTAAIYRQVTEIAREQGYSPPSYARVRQIVKKFEQEMQEKPTKPKIKDIASLAGVSKATVSRVFNNRPDVDPATRERILRIIEEQSYIPSMAAAGLAGGRRPLIGMLIPSFSWPLIPELMRGVADVLEDTSYELVLYSIKDTDREQDHSEVINRVLATQLTAGVLAVFPGTASPELTRLYDQGFPVVIVDDQRVHTAPWISVDDLTGAYMVVKHLIGLGHRRIAHIGGPAAYRASQERYEGYRRALLEFGIDPDPELTLEGDFKPPSGRARARQLFSLPAEKRPTAIFAAADEMAYGVISAAEEYGLSVPDDIALVGFDDDAPSAHVHPPLTTVRQPYYEMGEQGLRLLLSLLDSPPNNVSSAARSAQKAGEETPPARILLQTTLVVRASCGADFHIPVSTTTGNDVI